MALHCENPLLAGPDEESEQWLAGVARKQELDCRVGRKIRLSDHEMEIEFLPTNRSGRQLVIRDDIASTGRTLDVAAKALTAHKPASISVMMPHALFVGDALARLQSRGIEHIWSTDSIPHASNTIALAPLLMDALRLRPFGK